VVTRSREEDSSPRGVQEEYTHIIASLCPKSGMPAHTAGAGRVHLLLGPGRGERVHLLLGPGRGVHNEAMTPQSRERST